MKQLHYNIGLSIVAVMLLAACVPTTESSRPDLPTTSLPGSVSTPVQPTPPVKLGRLTVIPLPSFEPVTESNVSTTLKIDLALQSLIDAATIDLAQRLSIGHGTIEVVSAQSVVWPDRSLGCPQPGMVYPQVLADGYRIELRAQDQVYFYHGGEGRGPFLCENPSK